MVMVQITDVVMVAPRSRLHKVKEIAAHLKAANRAEHHLHLQV
jgi:hypothetical protein